jgi:hypothetical protein
MQRRCAVIKLWHARSLLLLGERAGTVQCPSAEVSCSRVNAEAVCRNKVVARSVPSPFGRGLG